VTEAERIQLEAELAGAEAKAAVLRERLGGARGRPARARRQAVNMPDPKDLEGVTSLDEQRVMNAARRKGHL
jgi:hypothetical protein